MTANHVIVRRPGGLRVLRVTLSTRRVKRVKRLEVGTSLRGVSRGDALCRADAEARDLAHACERLGAATRSESTWWSLVHVLSRTTAAPVRCVDPVPVLDPHVATDVRRWLCDSDALAALLRQLRGVAEAALERDRDPRRERKMRILFPAGGGVIDLYLYIQHRVRCPMGELELGGLHCEQVLPWLRGLPWSEVHSVVKTWDRLHAVAPGVAWAVLSRAEPRAIGDWLEFFLHYRGTANREALLRHWLHHGGPTTRFEESWRSLVPVALQVDDDDPFAGLSYLWNARREGCDWGRVRAGLHLWRTFGECLPSTGAGGDCSPLVERVLKRIPEDDHREFAALLFRRIGHARGLLVLLRTLLEETDCDRLFGRLLLLVRLSRFARRDASAQWIRLAENVSRLQDVFAALEDEFVDRGTLLFSHLIWRSPAPDPGLGEVLELVTALCRPPLGKGDEIAVVIGSLYSAVSGRGIHCLTKLPGSTWRRIDDACRSRTRAGKIATGLQRFPEDFEGFLLDGLNHRVRLLLKLLEHLGAHPEGSVEESLEATRNHPLFGVSLCGDGFAEHLPLLEHCLGGAASDPLGKLREIHEGRRPGRRDVIAKLLAEVRGHVAEGLTVCLEERLGADLRRRAEAFGGAVQDHTLLLIGDIHCNRRVLRRMLRSYVQQGESSILRHQLNSRWLEGNPELLKSGWLRANEAMVETGSHGVLTIRIEQRFEEVLKMGTLVNSCLAIGGCNSYSVVANALDANKQVVMAFDARGEFVARQLVAISDDGRLVCFEVYARARLTGDLLRAFAAYDRHLADALGIPVQGEEGYVVRPLLCREWYDDMAWNPLEVADREEILHVNPRRSPAELSF